MKKNLFKNVNYEADGFFSNIEQNKVRISLFLFQEVGSSNDVVLEF